MNNPNPARWSAEEWAAVEKAFKEFGETQQAYFKWVAEGKPKRLPS